jgi:hypothetical protein
MSQGIIHALYIILSESSILACSRSLRPATTRACTDAWQSIKRHESPSADHPSVSDGIEKGISTEHVAETR